MEMVVFVFALLGMECVNLVMPTLKKEIHCVEAVVLFLRKIRRVVKG